VLGLQQQACTSSINHFACALMSQEVSALLHKGVSEVVRDAARLQEQV
jgi:hypothetical protein